MSDAAPLLCVDMGTTRTRVWLVEGERIWSSVAEDFGVRDVARGGTPQALEDSLRSLLSRAKADALGAGLQTPIIGIAAAGMITSPLGLLNVPHIRAPAGASELARSIQRRLFDLDGTLPVYFVPGVATGDPSLGIDATLSSDLMRGEETLCVGLLATGQVAAGSAILNLGSHWKWISIDEEARIARSRTSLTGEMIHAIQTQTLLASALTQARPEAFDPEWLVRGGNEAASSGLSRALFCVRLLELAGTTTPTQRLSFLYGAFLEAEMRSLLANDFFSNLESVCLIGSPPLAEAWQRWLAAADVTSTVLSEGQRERAYLAGLQHLLLLL